MLNHIMRLLAVTLGVAVGLLVPRLALAQTPTCDALTGAKKQLATELINTQHLYDCCDDTIAACLKKSKCTLAKRLADQVCRLAGAGKDKAAITRSLSQRATSMMSARPMPIDLSKAERAGEANAPVTVTMYLCSRCPYCARLVPKLYKAVTEGQLKGVAKAYVREFPVRSHAQSTELALATVAARRLGKGWPYLLHLYSHMETLDNAKLTQYAVELGLDGQAFRSELEDPSVRAQLVASKREGVRNRVTATPTIFINGKRYSGDLDFESIVDVVQEQAERMRVKPSKANQAKKPNEPAK